MEIDRSRFTGFGGLYDSVRPRPPMQVVDLVRRYVEEPIRRVADLGCGTGLSSAIWLDLAGEVFGIEPTPDMAAIARRNHPRLKVLDAAGHDTGLDDASMDVVTCSQSFHWMEPVSTLGEVNRILRPGGVFAVYDCIWPPAFHRDAETAYLELFRKVGDIYESQPTLESSRGYYPKEEHLVNIEKSGYFPLVAEILFNNHEPCDAGRFMGIALSQGHLQKLVKAGCPGIDEALNVFSKRVESLPARDMIVSYRMILAVKKWEDAN